MCCFEMKEEKHRHENMSPVKLLYHINRDVRKPTVGVSDQGRHKPGSTATGTLKCVYEK